MVWPVQVEEEHALHVKTESELDERIASSEGEGRRRFREMQRQVGGRTVT